MITGYVRDPKKCHICGEKLEQFIDVPYRISRYHLWILRPVRGDPIIGYYIVRQCPKWAKERGHDSNGHYRRRWLLYNAAEGRRRKIDMKDLQRKVKTMIPPPILYCNSWSG